MAIKKTDDTNYRNIANAIRGKNGLQTTYLPPEMAGAINTLPSFWSGTQAEYDALTSYDNNTYYCIVEG